MEQSKIDLQARCSDFVRDHVYYCQSSLVDELLGKEIFNFEDIENSMQSDEEVMDGAGWNEEDLRKEYMDEEAIEKPEDIDQDEYATWLTEKCDGGREAKEIYEWWLCSDYLIRQLRDRGECILKNDYGEWWGRCSTGQSISMDGVIESIVQAA